MKTPNIILPLIALFALAGGALAFKANKFNGKPAFTFTDSFFTLGTVYTLAHSACLPINPSRFITNQGQNLTTVYGTTGVGPNQTITLTRLGGIQTTTFPVFLCVTIPDTFTTLVN